MHDCHVLPATVATLINTMSRHQGAENGIPAERLAHGFGVPTRTLRTVISAAREQGFAICGTPKDGYYLPTTPEELSESCEFLVARALKSLRLAARMRRISLPALVGQLNVTETEKS